jgi:hypothetical protein
MLAFIPMPVKEKIRKSQLWAVGVSTVMGKLMAGLAKANSKTSAVCFTLLLNRDTAMQRSPRGFEITKRDFS